MTDRAVVAPGFARRPSAYGFSSHTRSVSAGISIEVTVTPESPVL